MKRMKCIILSIVAIILLAAGSVALWLIATGPRMKVQQHIRAFQRVMPLPPSGSLAVEQAFGQPPLPVPATENPLEVGRSCYVSWCLACHGENGTGDGPVGDSYDPTPADLTGRRVAGLPDAVLSQKILIGPGHAPVLARVVPPDYLPYIVRYVKSLGSGK